MLQWLWETAWQFLKELNLQFLFDVAPPMPSVGPKQLETCPPGNWDMNVHSSIVHNSQQCPSTHGWLNLVLGPRDGILCNHERSKVLLGAVAWMSLENVVLREAKHKRPRMPLFHFHEMSRMADPEAESRLVVALSWGWGGVGRSTGSDGWQVWCFFSGVMRIFWN